MLAKNICLFPKSAKLNRLCLHYIYYMCSRVSQKSSKITIFDFFARLCLQLFSFLIYTARMEEYIYRKEDDLNAWNGVKYLLHLIHSVPNFSEGEVWWCSCGENVGVEINGKNKEFTQPVLVYHKYNKYSFLGIPLTSQEHTGSWYVPFKLQQRQNYAVLCQVRNFDAKRLHKRMGKVDENDLKRIIQGFNNLYIKNILPNPKD